MTEIDEMQPGRELDELVVKSVMKAIFTMNTPYYSVSDAAAFKVVDKMIERTEDEEDDGWEFALGYDTTRSDGDFWVADFYRNGTICATASGTTRAEAICKAALKAVEAERVSEERQDE